MSMKKSTSVVLSCLQAQGEYALAFFLASMSFVDMRIGYYLLANMI